MDPVSIWFYISLGEAMQYLMMVPEKTPVHGESYILNNIDGFFVLLQEFNLPTTQRASYQLRAFKEKLKNTDKEHNLTHSERRELNKIMDDIRSTLYAEASGKMVFIVTAKRTDVMKLLVRVESLMAAEVYLKLPDISKYDFCEAGRCIAFERPTAAAFHILRGTEAVLREFHFFVTGKKLNKGTWGKIIDSLQQTKNPPPKPLIDHLKNIKDSYRNPTQHPEMKYEMDEVQDLFNLCIEVVNRMVNSKDWKLRKRLPGFQDDFLRKMWKFLHPEL